MDLTDLSREVSYALRHAPWEYELEPDAEGFVPVGQLLAALNETGHYSRPVTTGDLEAVVNAPGKRRHEIRDGHIRALYGHSFPMRVAFEPACPPAVLYHGTARRFLPSIMEEGLRPMSRQYVHLSADPAGRLAPRPPRPSRHPARRRRGGPRRRRRLLPDGQRACLALQRTAGKVPERV